jgi:septal ring factor EnvC (AmiA/AmiB activator)
MIERWEAFAGPARSQGRACRRLGNAPPAFVIRVRDPGSLTNDGSGGSLASAGGPANPDILMHTRIVASRNRIRASAGVSLLIVLSCGLCGLVAYQWYRDADLRMQIADRNKQIHQLNEQKHEVETTGKRVEEELKRVEQLKERLTEQDKTNKVELSRTKRDLSEMTVKWERSTKQGDAYKAAYDKMSTDIKAQNESIKKLNEAYLNAVNVNKDTVEKYKKLAGDCEELNQRYNKLFEQAEKLQQALNTQAAEKK